MSSGTIEVTLENAIDLIRNSSDTREINCMISEIGRLTYTKIRDINYQLFSAERLEKAGANPFITKFMGEAEKRIQEIKAS